MLEMATLLTRMVRLLVAVRVAESVTVAVKVKDPAAVGVPEMSPDAASSVSPGGSDPAGTDQE
jgi:hypothetical protein